MTLNLEDINRISHLARLELSNQESETVLNQLNNFFDFVEQIKEIKTENILPLSHPASLVYDCQLNLHEDIVKEKNQREQNMKNAPEQAENLFLVPKIIE